MALFLLLLTIVSNFITLYLNYKEYKRLKMIGGQENESY